MRVFTLTSTRGWGAVFLITGLFQIYRKAPLDALLFFTGFALFLKDPLGAQENKGLYKISNFASRVLAVIAVVALVIIPIHNPFAGVFSFLLLPFLYRLMLLDKTDGTFAASKHLVRSAKAWAVLLILTAFWELSMYISAVVTGDENKYPTITDLIDPKLVGYLDKLIFITFWVYLGLRLMKLLEKK